MSANDNSQPSDGGCKSKSPGNDPLLLEVVDDMCTALPAHKLQELLDHLNGVEPSIQFTVETELKGKLPFLDVLLQRA